MRSHAPHHAEDEAALRMQQLATHFLVVCPRCEGCAEVRTTDGAQAFGRAARLVCTQCGLVRRAKLASWSVGNREDWYFHLPLWLQTSCLARTLWAYNPLHLSLMEDYIAADQRKRRHIRRCCCCRDYVTQPMEALLPRWMVL